jgi:hypothetical protein
MYLRLILAVAVLLALPLSAAAQQERIGVSYHGERQLVDWTFEGDYNLSGCGQFFIYGQFTPDENLEAGKIGFGIRFSARQKLPTGFVLSPDKIKVFDDETRLVAPTAEVFLSPDKVVFTKDGGIEFSGPDIVAVFVRISNYHIRRAKCLPPSLQTWMTSPQE